MISLFDRHANSGHEDEDATQYIKTLRLSYIGRIISTGKLSNLHIMKKAQSVWNSFVLFLQGKLCFRDITATLSYGMHTEIIFQNVFCLYVMLDSVPLGGSFTKTSALVKGKVMDFKCYPFLSPHNVMSILYI